jgi:hypothetical protein
MREFHADRVKISRVADCGRIIEIKINRQDARSAKPN